MTESVAASLLAQLQHAGIQPTGVTADSRRVTSGDLFLAFPGLTVDGRDYIAQAIASGACAVIVEAGGGELPAATVPMMTASGVRGLAGFLADAIHGRPSEHVWMAGVTGTNGKTTITYLLEAILRQQGRAPAVFGTVEYRLGERSHAASHTTPESIELMRLMSDFRQQGADAMIMEVSSHALEQHRVDGIRFDLAIFTNLTPEHLDYHLTMEGYFASKRRLFVDLLQSGKAVINRDDPSGVRLLQENSAWIAFGSDRRADVFPLRVTVGRDGIHGVFSSASGEVSIESHLIGDFNVSNLLAAVAAAQQLGIKNEIITLGISSLRQVPGRLEKVENRKGVLALVDYAHTGDALEQVLKTLVKLEHRRLYTLVGCGGDRDPGKRPVMGRVAVKYSDLTIFTSDNPRTEDPDKILAQIRAGALAAGSQELSKEQALTAPAGFVVIPDRRAAIEFACRLAGEGDLLLVAGKGHEDYQILGTEKIHFDDREELARALNSGPDPVSVGVKDHV